MPFHDYNYNGSPVGGDIMHIGKPTCSKLSNYEL